MLTAQASPACRAPLATAPRMADEPPPPDYPLEGHDGLQQLRNYICGCEWNNGAHPCAWWRPGMEWGGPGTAPATPDAATLTRLATQPGLWAPWDAAVERALQRTALELQRRAGWQKGERIVKSWAAVAHTAAGRQVERVLVATDRALYRCAFSYRDGTLGEARRSEWRSYAQLHLGPFKYKPGALPGLGDWYLAREVNGTYGWRLLYRRAAPAPAPPSAAALPGAMVAAAVGFLHENVVDNGVYLTFSALVPPDVARAGPAAAAAFQRDTAAEVALVWFGLMLAACADRHELLSQTLATALHSLPYSASAALLAAGHHALGFSRECHDLMRGTASSTVGNERQGAAAWGDGPPVVSPWDAPNAGELPKSGKLIVRRCT